MTNAINIIFEYEYVFDKKIAHFKILRHLGNKELKKNYLFSSCLIDYIHGFCIFKICLNIPLQTFFLSSNNIFLK